MDLPIKYNGQVEQDKFVLNLLKFKKKGFFLEIGSNRPIIINNTYLLEKDYEWNGIMIEYDKQFLKDYKELRPNNIHVINDATKIDYKKLFETNNVPLNMDYLQIDLEVANGSTLRTLKKMDNEVMDKYKFATITFEHDVYRDNDKNKIFKETRSESRKIFENRGYICVFEDIQNTEPHFVFEDWWVHPELVDIEYVNLLKEKNKNNYENNSITGKSISWKNIEY